MIAVAGLGVYGCGDGGGTGSPSTAAMSTSAAAPGVPVSKHGDNSIQKWGLEADASERNRVAGLVREYLDARAAGEWASACGFLAAKQRREQERIGKGQVGCGKVMEAFAADESAHALEEAAEIDVYSLRVGGGFAFLIYRRPDRRFYATALKREGGKWGIVTVTPNPIY